MNRNQLMAFTIAYDTRNLVRTADKMYVSQSAISQQLRKLEDELHTELFVHKKGQIVPNEYGDLFYPYAKEALAALSRGRKPSVGGSRQTGTWWSIFILITAIRPSPGPSGSFSRPILTFGWRCAGFPGREVFT